MFARSWISLSFVGLVALSLTTVLPANAGVSGDLRGGVYTDAEELFLGGGVVFDVAPRWEINPNLEWVFVDNGDLLTLNGDVLYDLTARSGLAIWAGAGLAVLNRDNDRGNDDTDLGLNLIAGLGRKEGSVRPFGQAKVILADDTEFVLMGGIRF